MGPVKSSERRGKSTSSPYHKFFQGELKRIKQENPSMSHKEAFKQAGLNWRTSPLNPKNKTTGTGPSQAGDTTLATGKVPPPMTASAAPAHVSAPEAVAPEVVAPEAVAPAVVAPEALTPEVPAPTMPVPEVPAPEVPAPEVPAPEVPAPEVPAPEGQGPEALDTPVHVGLQAGPAVLEAAAVPGMLSVASAIDSCPAASLYSVHAGPDASAPTASAAVLDADVGSAEKRPEKPLGELASSSGGSEPIKALPSMAAHAVGGALTAAK